jgi:hypothetical protein
MASSRIRWWAGRAADDLAAAAGALVEVGEVDGVEQDHAVVDGLRAGADELAGVAFGGE